MGVRVTYRRRTSYNTRSNRIRKVKTPGGRVVVQYPNKKTTAATCADSNLNVALNGLKRIRPTKLAQLSRRDRTVSRPYGGVISAAALKNRIVRAFLVEEVKIVKQIKK